MWLRRRRRRRIALGLGGVVYLAAVAWLISPLWTPPARQLQPRTPVRRLVSGPRLQVPPLAVSAAVPTTLPGSGSGATAELASGESATSESPESVSVEEAPESGASEESSPPPVPSSGGESGRGGESKTVIGFEG